MNIVYPKAEEEKKQYQERYELAAGRVREVYEELCRNIPEIILKRFPVIL
jgi:dsDNA-specific endonuclease/ATPase MutS2